MKITEFKVLATQSYQQASKQLSKRFRHLDSDVQEFLCNVDDIKSLGTPLGKDFYKVRIANSDKNKGKSAGYRLITLIKIIETSIYLVYIYDKSELENISEQELDSLITDL